MKAAVETRTSTSTASRIHISPPEERGGRIYWEGELRLPSGECHRIYFDFTAPVSRPDLIRPRPFLLAFLLPAMHAGAPLELDLPVDAVTRNNLMEWQEAMASWNPQVLKVVPIIAPLDERPVPATEAGALTAFSGGVDSYFTAWRHRQSPDTAAFRRTTLQAGLMVHGFDIPLAEEDVFERAFQRSRAMLESLGLEPFRMKTNLRSMDQVPGCSWGASAHGIWLAATLACYEPWFGRILIPSTFHYPSLWLPWGSSPVTDPLFSSATTDYWHDAGAQDKLTKVLAIARENAAQQHLRVCWEGPHGDRNCGKCSKCLITRVAFHLAGVDQLAAFPEPWTLDLVSSLMVKGNAYVAKRDQLVMLLTEAQRQSRAPLVRALTLAVSRSDAHRRQQKFKQLFRSRIIEPFRCWRRAKRSALKAQWQRLTGKLAKPGTVVTWVSALLAAS